MPPAPESNFDDDGWAIIHNFLDPDELESVSAILDDVLMLPRPPCMKRPGNDLIPLRWNDAIVARFLASKRRIQRLRDLLRANDLRWLAADGLALNHPAMKDNADRTTPSVSLFRFWPAR